VNPDQVPGAVIAPFHGNHGTWHVNPFLIPSGTLLQGGNGGTWHVNPFPRNWRAGAGFQGAGKGSAADELPKIVKPGTGTGLAVEDL